MAFGKLQDIPHPCPGAGEPQPCLTLLSCGGGLSSSVQVCLDQCVCVCVRSCVQTELPVHGEVIGGSPEPPRLEQRVPGSR